MLLKSDVQWLTLPTLTEYNNALTLMDSYVEDVITGEREETILLVEHEDVYTAGSSASNDELLNVGDIPVIYTRRGGKITYHGPGQRVIYPILNLGSTHRKKDLKLYVRNLELWLINTLKEIGIEAFIINGMVGIWVNSLSGPAKIAAIGVRVKKWVTYHGIAINICTDLTKYNGIIPCGISNFSVTSIKELGLDISFNEFDRLLKQNFKKVF